MTNMKSTITLALVLLFTSLTALRAAENDDATIRLDITYKTIEQRSLRLDLHYPAAPTPDAKYPLVVFTHGGGWSAGNKTIGDRGVRFLGVSALTAQGFCVASVDYRLCQNGKITMRDCVTDSKDALRYLAKNAANLSLDAQHVFTWGDSAGGQIAQMLLLSPPDSFPGDPNLADAEYRLIAGVSWYGPCDFEKTELFNRPGESGVRDQFGPRIVKSGVDPKDRLAAYREVSPVNYLKPDSPPLLMIQGDKDTTIPVHHARYMKERADIVKAPVEILIVENSGHNWREIGGPVHPSVDEIAKETAAFMKQHLERSVTKGNHHE